MTAENVSDGPSYELDPKPSRGLALDLSLSRLLGVGGGLIGAIVALLVTRQVLIAVVPAAVGAAWAWMPIHGRPAAEQLPVIAGHAGRRAGGASEWVAPVAPATAELSPDVTIVPARPAHRKGDVARGETIDWPAELGGRMSMTSVGSGVDEVALLLERRGRRRSFTALVSADAPGWALADPEERDRRVAGWAAVLAGLARNQSVPTRLQMVESLRPDPGVEQADWIAAHAALADPVELAGYRRMVVDGAGAALTHQVTLALRVPTRRMDASAAELVTREVAMLTDGLRVAGISAAPLSPEGAARRIRQALTPDPRLDSRAVDPASSGPAARQERYSAVRVDGWWHTVAWIQTWPGQQLSAGWMLPFLTALPGGAARSISVHMEALPPAAAARSARQQQMSSRIDTQQRRRWGFVESEAGKLKGQRIDQRAREVAEGAAMLRYVGLVDLAAPTREELEVAVAALAQYTARSGMTVTRLYGQQHRGLAACVPIGRLDFARGWQA